MLIVMMAGCGSNNSDAPAGGSDDNTSGGGGVETPGTISRLSIVNGGVISVGVGAAEQTIRLRALDKNGFFAKEGQAYVKYDVNGTSYGILTPGSANVEDGIITFTYTPPSNIQELLDRNITTTQFRFYAADTSGKIDANVYADLTVNFSATTTTPEQSRLSKIVLLKSNYEAMLPKEQINITVYAFDQNNNAMQNINLLLKSGESENLGSFPTSVKIVDGEGNFTYVAPAKFPTDPTKTDTILITDTAFQVSAIATVSFGPHTLTPTLTVDSGDFNLTKDAEQKTVTIIAKDSNGVPLTKGHIDLVLPNGSNIGTFAESQVAINTNGVATFHYTGPDPLVEQPVKTFTFQFDENTSVSTTLTVGYTPLVTTTVVPKKVLVFESNQLVNEVNITQNSEKRTFEVQVWGDNDQPFDGGNVRVSFPIADIQNGTDVGYFTEYIVPCVNGKATFEYNAPSNISDRNDSFAFGFYHDDTNSIAATQKVTFNMRPSGTQPIITTYTMEISPVNDDGTMNLESIKEFTAKVVDSDGNEIGESDGNYTITNLNPTLADLIDSSNARSDQLTLNNTRRATFRLESSRVSGAVPIRIHVQFKDINGDIQTLEKVINQVILSGPPTAISLSYAGVVQDEAHAKFIDKIVVTATDKYFNRVNIQPAVSASLIVGYARDKTQTTANNKKRRLYFAPDGGSTASLSAAQNTITVNGGIDLSDVDLFNDIVMTFGVGYKYESSGKWDFNTSYAPTSSDTLGILDDIIKDENTLGYAIGHNYRDEMCDSGTQWTGYVSYENDQTKLDENGMAIININYDYYLTGKDVVLGINIIGNDANNSKVVRIGTSKKLTLRGMGLEAPTVSVPKGVVGKYFIPIKIANTPEYYKNGRFTYNATLEGTNGGVITGSEAKFYVDANQSECAETITTLDGTVAPGGVAGVVVDVNNSQGVEGILKLNNLVIENEF